MAGPQFEWDENKNKENIKKHGISFDEGMTVFADENALLLHDPDHSKQEDRFLLLGLSFSLRMLVVCHCYRAPMDMIRIFSARKATKRERGQYIGRQKL